MPYYLTPRNSETVPVTAVRVNHIVEHGTLPGVDQQGIASQVYARSEDLDGWIVLTFAAHKERISPDVKVRRLRSEHRGTSAAQLPPAAIDALSKIGAQGGAVARSEFEHLAIDAGGMTYLEHTAHVTRTADRYELTQRGVMALYDSTGSLPRSEATTSEPRATRP